MFCIFSKNEQSKKGERDVLKQVAEGEEDKKWDANNT